MESDFLSYFPFLLFLMYINKYTIYNVVKWEELKVKRKII